MCQPTAATHPTAISSEQAISSRRSRAAAAAAGMEESGARTAVVRRLMAAKVESGKSFSDIAAETGLTNVYVAQLLRRQAQLKPDTAPALRAAVPGLTDELVELMLQPPFRFYHPDIVHEPAIYRCLVCRNLVISLLPVVSSINWRCEGFAIALVWMRVVM